MKTRPKDLGTSLESWIVKQYENLRLQAYRIHEGGANDEGDVRAFDSAGREWVIEAKYRQALNATRELAKARKKGGRNAVLVWKRNVKKDGKKRRGPDGEPVVVVIAWDTWLDIMEGKHDS